MDTDTGQSDPLSFEDAVSHLNWLEQRLRSELQHNILEFKLCMTQGGLDAIVGKATKLFQVRMQQTSGRVLSRQEAEILRQFDHIKRVLATCDDEAVNRTQAECLVLGNKLAEVRKRQRRLSGQVGQLERVLNALLAGEMEAQNYAVEVMTTADVEMDVSVPALEPYSIAKPSVAALPHASAAKRSSPPALTLPKTPPDSTSPKTPPASTSPKTPPASTSPPKTSPAPEQSVGLDKLQSLAKWMAEKESELKAQEAAGIVVEEFDPSDLFVTQPFQVFDPMEGGDDRLQVFKVAPIALDRDAKEVEASALLYESSEEHQSKRLKVETLAPEEKSEIEKISAEKHMENHGQDQLDPATQGDKVDDGKGGSTEEKPKKKKVVKKIVKKKVEKGKAESASNATSEQDGTSLSNESDKRPETSDPHCTVPLGMQKDNLEHINESESKTVSEDILTADSSQAMGVVPMETGETSISAQQGENDVIIDGNISAVASATHSVNVAEEVGHYHIDNINIIQAILGVDGPAEKVAAQLPHVNAEATSQESVSAKLPEYVNSEGVVNQSEEASAIPEAPAPPVKVQRSKKNKALNLKQQSVDAVEAAPKKESIDTPLEAEKAAKIDHVSEVTTEQEAAEATREPETRPDDGEQQAQSGDLKHYSQNAQGKEVEEMQEDTKAEEMHELQNACQHSDMSNVENVVQESIPVHNDMIPDLIQNLQPDKTVTTDTETVFADSSITTSTTGPDTEPNMPLTSPVSVVTNASLIDEPCEIICEVPVVQNTNIEEPSEESIDQSEWPPKTDSRLQHENEQKYEITEQKASACPELPPVAEFELQEEQYDFCPEAEALSSLANQVAIEPEAAIPDMVREELEHVETRSNVGNFNLATSDTIKANEESKEHLGDFSEILSNGQMVDVVSSNIAAEDLHLAQVRDQEHLENVNQSQENPDVGGVTGVIEIVDEQAFSSAEALSTLIQNQTILETEDSPIQESLVEDVQLQIQPSVSLNYDDQQGGGPYVVTSDSVEVVDEHAHTLSSIQEQSIHHDLQTKDFGTQKHLAAEDIKLGAQQCDKEESFEVIQPLYVEGNSTEPTSFGVEEPIITSTGKSNVFVSHCEPTEEEEFHEEPCLQGSNPEEGKQLCTMTSATPAESDAAVSSEYIVMEEAEKQSFGSVGEEIAQALNEQRNTALSTIMPILCSENDAATSSDNILMEEAEGQGFGSVGEEIAQASTEQNNMVLSTIMPILCSENDAATSSDNILMEESEGQCFGSVDEEIAQASTEQSSTALPMIMPTFCSESNAAISSDHIVMEEAERESFSSVDAEITHVDNITEEELTTQDPSTVLVDNKLTQEADFVSHTNEKLPSLDNELSMKSEIHENTLESEDLPQSFARHDIDIISDVAPSRTQAVPSEPAPLTSDVDMAPHVEDESTLSVRDLPPPAHEPGEDALLEDFVVVPEDISQTLAEDDIRDTACPSDSGLDNFVSVGSERASDDEPNSTGLSWTAVNREAAEAAEAVGWKAAGYEDEEEEEDEDYVPWEIEKATKFESQEAESDVDMPNRPIENKADHFGAEAYSQDQDQPSADYSSSAQRVEAQLEDEDKAWGQVDTPSAPENAEDIKNVGQISSYEEGYPEGDNSAVDKAEAHSEANEQESASREKSNQFTAAIKDEQSKPVADEQYSNEGGKSNEGAQMEENRPKTGEGDTIIAEENARWQTIDISQLEQPLSENQMEVIEEMCVEKRVAPMEEKDAEDEEVLHANQHEVAEEIHIQKKTAIPLQAETISLQTAPQQEEEIIEEVCVQRLVAPMGEKDAEDKTLHANQHEIAEEIHIQKKAAAPLQEEYIATASQQGEVIAQKLIATLEGTAALNKQNERGSTNESLELIAPPLEVNAENNAAAVIQQKEMPMTSEKNADSVQKPPFEKKLSFAKEEEDGFGDLETEALASGERAERQRQKIMVQSVTAQVTDLTSVLERESTGADFADLADLQKAAGARLDEGGVDARCEAGETTVASEMCEDNAGTKKEVPLDVIQDVLLRDEEEEEEEHELYPTDGAQHAVIPDVIPQAPKRAPKNAADEGSFNSQDSYSMGGQIEDINYPEEAFNPTNEFIEPQVETDVAPQVPGRGARKAAAAEEHQLSDYLDDYSDQEEFTRLQSFQPEAEAIPRVPARTQKKEMQSDVLQDNVYTDQDDEQYHQYEEITHKYAPDDYAEEASIPQVPGRNSRKAKSALYEEQLGYQEESTESYEEDPYYGREELQYNPMEYDQGMHDEEVEVPQVPGRHARKANPHTYQNKEDKYSDEPPSFFLPEEEEEDIPYTSSGQTHGGFPVESNAMPEDSHRNNKSIDALFKAAEEMGFKGVSTPDSNSRPQSGFYFEGDAEDEDEDEDDLMPSAVELDLAPRVPGRRKMPVPDSLLSLTSQLDPDSEQFKQRSPSVGSVKEKYFQGLQSEDMPFEMFKGSIGPVDSEEEYDYEHERRLGNSESGHYLAFDKDEEMYLSDPPQVRKRSKRTQSSSREREQQWSSFASPERNELLIPERGGASGYVIGAGAASVVDEVNTEDIYASVQRKPRKASPSVRFSDPTPDSAPQLTKAAAQSYQAKEVEQYKMAALALAGAKGASASVTAANEAPAARERRRGQSGTRADAAEDKNDVLAAIGDTTLAAGRKRLRGNRQDPRRAKQPADSEASFTRASSEWTEDESLLLLEKELDSEVMVMADDEADSHRGRFYLLEEPVDSRPKKVSFAEKEQSVTLRPDPEVLTLPGTRMFTFLPSRTHEQPRESPKPFPKTQKEAEQEKQELASLDTPPTVQIPFWEQRARASQRVESGSLRDIRRAAVTRNAAETAKPPPPSPQLRLDVMSAGEFSSGGLRRVQTAPVMATTPKAFLSAMTSGIIPATSGNTSRDSSHTRSEDGGGGAQGTLFGSLMRRGRHFSRQESKDTSRTSSADRAASETGIAVTRKSRSLFRLPFQHIAQDVANHKGMAAASSTSSLDRYKSAKSSLEPNISDCESDGKFLDLRRGRKKSKKTVQLKVDPVDKPPAVSPDIVFFDQLFQKKGVFEAAAAAAALVASPSGLAPETAESKTAKGSSATPTSFEVYSREAAFKQSQKEAGIGFEEKVHSYLVDQQQVTKEKPFFAQQTKQHSFDSQQEHNNNNRVSGRTTPGTKPRMKVRSRDSSLQSRPGSSRPISPQEFLHKVEQLVKSAEIELVDDHDDVDYHDQGHMSSNKHLEVRLPLEIAADRHIPQRLKPDRLSHLGNGGNETSFDREMDAFEVEERYRQGMDTIKGMLESRHEEFVGGAAFSKYNRSLGRAEWGDLRSQPQQPRDVSRERPAAAILTSTATSAAAFNLRQRSASLLDPKINTTMMEKKNQIVENLAQQRKIIKELKVRVLVLLLIVLCISILGYLQSELQ